MDTYNKIKQLQTNIKKDEEQICWLNQEIINAKSRERTGKIHGDESQVIKTKQQQIELRQNNIRKTKANIANLEKTLQQPLSLF